MKSIEPLAPNKIEKSSLWQKLKHGLQKTSDQFSDNLKGLLSKRKLTEDVLNGIEEALILSDMGVNTASRLKHFLQNQRLGQDVTEEEVRQFLSTEIIKILDPIAKPLPIPMPNQLMVILIVGVNGAGKTTTLSKLSQYWIDLGYKVGMVAGDTFRAAAVEQLQIWAQRLNISFYSTKPQGDAAGLVFTAMEKAKEDKLDILCIDTAGRLHNKEHLMEELRKIVRVIQKIDNKASHHTILVLDATTGQNAHNQIDAFKKTVAINGLILTKLDGTAKGGIVVSLAEKYKLPIYAIGVGEQVNDMQPFNAADFSNHLLSLN